MMKKIDLNCDLGESFGDFIVGNDELVLPFVSSVNIACGFHSGDPHVMRKTVQLAKENGVAIGAHPGFQDLQGFGRRALPLSPSEVYDLILYQIGALDAFCRSSGVRMNHVKPHGALYNLAAKDAKLAEAIATAVASFDSDLILYGLAGSEMIHAGAAAGLQTAAEGFADRTYQEDGTLTSRNQPNALIHDAEVALRQVLQMVGQGTVTTLSGKTVPVKVDTICLHGDNEQAILFAQKLNGRLSTNGMTISPVRGAAQ